MIRWVRFRSENVKKIQTLALFFAAFSTFAFAEYFVAAANMGYYWTLVSDLPDEELVVSKPKAIEMANGHTAVNNKKEN